MENNRTIIYVKGVKFNQCKYLLFNIPIHEIQSFNEIKSIDEAAEKLNNPFEVFDQIKVKIPAETEFWGHCSNLQAWAENNYDSRLLHRNMAFPLLKKLVQEGDHIAKKVFKEEIAKRIASGHPSVISFLVKRRYLDFINREELEALVLDPNLDILKVLLKIFNRESDLFKRYLIQNLLKIGISLFNLLKEEIEIIDRLNQSSILYDLIGWGYFDYLNEDEMRLLIDEKNSSLKNKLAIFVKKILIKSLDDKDSNTLNSVIRFTKKIEFIPENLIKNELTRMIENIDFDQFCFLLSENIFEDFSKEILESLVINTSSNSKLIRNFIEALKRENKVIKRRIGQIFKKIKLKAFKILDTEIKIMTKQEKVFFLYDIIDSGYFNCLEHDEMKHFLSNINREAIKKMIKFSINNSIEAFDNLDFEAMYLAERNLRRILLIAKDLMKEEIRTCTNKKDIKIISYFLENEFLELFTKEELAGFKLNNG